MDTPLYQDSDFVYVDPFTRTVVGKVEWTKDGLPKSKTFEFSAPVAPPEKEAKAKPEKGRGRKPPSRRHYPWGTYRSMKRIYRLEGKVKDVIEPGTTLDSVLPKALEQPFWN